MMRSLYSGVAGLRTHQTKMDVLGNNIANVNTTSFKSQSITFSDLMYQTTQTASGATETKGGVNARQIGLGAKSGAIATAIESQGATQTTNNPFDIMITGKSFFVVNNGKENLYTRDGSFYVDGAGNLAMQSNGYLVQGWVAQEDKETGEIKVNRNGGLSALQIMSADNSTFSPASTTQALYSGNIDDHDTNVTSDDGKTITLEFYDNKGYLYTGKFTLKDTGTDHLFSLELTDIIDSDGNSINQTITLPDGTTTKRLDHVKFGTTQSKDQTVDAAYEVVVGTSTSVINLLPGAVVKDGVPTSGTLADLMTTSRSKYAGVLDQVYGITDAMITSGTNGYSKTSAYSISTDGQMTITYDDPKGTYKSEGYSFVANNTGSYYVNSALGGIAYQAPSATTDAEFQSALSRSKYLENTLKTVFGMSDDEFTEFANDSKYRFSFAFGSNGTDTLKVFRNTTLPEANQKIEENPASLAANSADFIGTGTYESVTLEDALAGVDTPVFYTYSNDSLTVYRSKMDDDTGTAKQGMGAQTYFDEGDLSVVELDELVPYPGSATQQSDLATILYGAGLITTDPAVDLVGAINEAGDYMTEGGYTNYKLVSVTGDNALILYTQEPGYVIDTDSDSLFKGERFSVTFDNSDTKAAYKLGTPAKLLTSAAKGSAYALNGTEEKVSDYSAEMLKDVYGITLPDPKVDANYKVNLTSAGFAIYDTVEYPAGVKDAYAAQVAEDGTITYVTTERTQAYKNPVPNTGNITDLLSTATGEYKNLLKDVYGVSDEDADAYGSDGTYAINADGSITLTTGTHTIQLEFDASNGSLVSANNNLAGLGTGLVKMIFDQDERYGMEAFGYQKGANDSDEIDPGQMVFDFSTVTNYNTSGSSTIKAVKGDKKSLNTGRAVGEMNGVTVSTDGQIYATYSNGQTKLLGQIASAEFANASGLSKEGDNLYASTLNSGEATIQDITTDGGYMNTGVLEMSNVDLSKEFTEMITTQRGFQANSRIITVSDTLLEELTNLKR